MRAVHGRAGSAADVTPHGFVISGRERLPWDQ
jgi:hypothetical protein